MGFEHHTVQAVDGSQGPQSKPRPKPLRPQDMSVCLRSVGLRPTKQRLALARTLFCGGDRHVSAESLHAEVTAQGISVSMATVYNALHCFLDAGLIRQVVVDSTRTYFDTNTAPHHHFFDERANTLTDIPVGAVDLGTLPQAPAGKRIASVDVILRLVPEDEADNRSR